MLRSMDSDENIDAQWEFIRAHHDYLIARLRNRTLSRSGNVITLNRRRRRRGRFSKMQKLTAEQVEELFPKITYKEWLSSGKKDYTHILHEEDIELDEITGRNDRTDDEDEEVGSKTHSTVISMVQEDTRENSSANHRDLATMPHYTSGSCAICLEIIEDDDEVRGLMCGHVFHSDCLDPWLTKRRACCPMCKRDYYTSDITTNNGNNESNESSTDNTENDTDNQENHRNHSHHRNHFRIHNHADDVRINRLNSNAPTSTPINNTTNNTSTNDISTTHDSNNDIDLGEARERGIIRRVTIEGANRDSSSVGEGARGAERERGRGERESGNREAGDDREEDSDFDDFNFETFRTDPVIRAMLQELIPPAERVRLILSDPANAGLNLEENANVLADKKFNNFFKRLWWRIMGINRENLYYWAVDQLYGRARRAQVGEERNEEGNETNNNEENNDNDNGIINTEMEERSRDVNRMV